MDAFQMHRSHAEATIMWKLREKTLHDKSQLQQNNRQLESTNQHGMMTKTSMCLLQKFQ